MAGAKLRVTPEKLRSGSSQFASADSKVQNTTRQIMNIVNGLSSWKGEASQGFCQKLRSLEGDCNKIHRMIDEHQRELRQAADSYTSTENENVSAGSALKNDVVQIT